MVRTMPDEFAPFDGRSIDLLGMEPGRYTGPHARRHSSMSNRPVEQGGEPIWPREALLGLIACARASQGRWLSFRDAAAERMFVGVDSGQVRTTAPRPILAAFLRAKAVDTLALQFAQRHSSGVGISLFGQLCTRGVRLSHELRWVDLDTRGVARFKRSHLPVTRGYRQRTVSFDSAQWCPTLLRGLSPCFVVLGEVWAAMSQTRWAEALGALGSQLPPGSEIVAFRPRNSPFGLMAVGGGDSIVTLGNRRYPTLRPLRFDATRRRLIGMGPHLAPAFAPSVHHLQVV